MTETFESGELFIYRKAPGVYELGVIKCKRDDRTYYCYYSQGETAAATPAPLMHKLVNAKWAPIQWANLFDGNRLILDDLLCVVPEKHPVLITQVDVDAYRSLSYAGSALGVPDCFRGLRVTNVRATSWGIDIEVIDV